LFNQRNVNPGKVSDVLLRDAEVFCRSFGT
jgi:hypothetical protein